MEHRRRIDNSETDVQLNYEKVLLLLLDFSFQ